MDPENPQAGIARSFFFFSLFFLLPVIASPKRSSRELFLWAGPEVTLVISHVERRH